MRLHLFNPWNDLALAANIDNYTPPKAAVRLARAGALMPMWLARSNDAVLVPDEVFLAEAEKLRELYGLEGRAVTAAPGGVTGCVPWGWSRAARRRLMGAGVAYEALPDDGWLDRHRALSSREVTVELACCLGLEPPCVAHSAKEALAAVAANEAKGLDSFMKMPWSCSGRGVFATTRMRRDEVERRAADIVRVQGCVIIEPDHGRRADFAALYRLEGGRAKFHSLSLFDTDSRGAYRGNFILSDGGIISRLGVDPLPWAERVGQAIQAVVAPYYTGWAGVDMVVTHSNEIYPLIELNLRATMGVVAAAMRRCITSPSVLSLTPSGVMVRPEEEDFTGRLLL
ncbi:MAG: hypothetical protein NC342_02880 [Pseudoflavonifractor sp.]|nr:hypothetical protein [Pseudoflavonifractor sp.]